MTRIGPAGWSYKDWRGIVYPLPEPRGFRPLTFLAQYFDTVEINVSFYRPVPEKTAALWLEQVSNAPDFRFTAKLWRGFTHDRNVSSQDVIEVTAGLRILLEANCLGALLLQFPWSFRNTPDNVLYLVSLQQRFCEFPLVLEVRHASWNEAAVLDILSERGIGLCNIDQPLFQRSIKPSALATTATGYVRLHGRNYRSWFTENAYQGERYDYLYSVDELEPWIDRIRTVSAAADDTYVVTNNHYLGKAVVNAIEIQSILKSQPQAAPGRLVEYYPDLAAFTQPARRPQQLGLL